MITYTNEDCMIGMARYPDKYFELAIIDPPYGIGKRLVSGGSGHSFDSLVMSGADKWDTKPEPLYFTELFRTSKNQIIWGGNFFELPSCEKPLCWNKLRPNQKNLSEWEYAWTSFVGRAEMFTFCANGGFVTNETRIHPTQKPVALYKWLLKNYAHPGDKILDTHVGSASSLIACYDMGFDAVGFELDPDYFKASTKRLADHMAQIRFDIPTQTVEQITIDNA